MPLRYIERDISRSPAYQPLPAENLAELAHTIEQQHQQGVAAMYGGGSGGGRRERGERGHAQQGDFTTLSENLSAGAAGLPASHRGELERTLSEHQQKLESVADEHGYRSLGPLVQRESRELAQRLKPFMADAENIRNQQAAIRERSDMPDFMRQYYLNQTVGESEFAFDPETGEYNSVGRQFELPEEWVDRGSRIGDWMTKIEYDTDADEHMRQIGVTAPDPDNPGKRVIIDDSLSSRLTLDHRSPEKIEGAIMSMLLNDPIISRQMSLELEALGLNPMGDALNPEGIPVTRLVPSVDENGAMIFDESGQPVMEEVAVSNIEHMASREAQPAVRARQMERPRFADTRQIPTATSASEQDLSESYHNNFAGPIFMALDGSPLDSLDSARESVQASENQVNQAQRRALRLIEEGHQGYTDAQINEDGTVSLLRNGQIIEGSPTAASINTEIKQAQQDKANYEEFRDRITKRITGKPWDEWWENNQEDYDRILNEEAAKIDDSAGRIMGHGIQKEDPVRQRMEREDLSFPEARQKELEQRVTRRMEKEHPDLQKVNKAFEEAAQKGEFKATPIVPFTTEKEWADFENRRFFSDISAGRGTQAVFDMSGEEITEFDELKHGANFDGFQHHPQRGWLMVWSPHDEEGKFNDEVGRVVSEAPQGVAQYLVSKGLVDHGTMAISQEVSRAASHPGVAYQMPINDEGDTLSIRQIERGASQEGSFIIEGFPSHWETDTDYVSADGFDDAVVKILKLMQAEQAEQER